MACLCLWVCVLVAGKVKGWLWTYSEKEMVSRKSLPAVVPGYGHLHSIFPPDFLSYSIKYLPHVRQCAGANRN